jgi:hypothetical protein
MIDTGEESVNVQSKRKIYAVEMTLILLISGTVGYVLLSNQAASKGHDDTRTIQEEIKTTDDPVPPVKAHIKAGPLTGYGPLTVHFYGNPDNDTDIVSYQWDFGPAGSYILSESSYSTIKDRPIFKRTGMLFAGCALLFGITWVTTFLQMKSNPFSFGSTSQSITVLAGCFMVLFVTVLIGSVIFNHQARLNRQYTSTERDPTMVFLNVGSYSATLTVTDSQGNTATDTVWITVLQYVYPDHDNDHD